MVHASWFRVDAFEFGVQGFQDLLGHGGGTLCKLQLVRVGAILGYRI